MLQYKTVLLDLDNTIYSYEPCHQAGKKSLLEVIEARFKTPKIQSEESYARSRSVINQRLKHTAASHHRLLYIQLMCEELNIPVIPNAEKLYEAYWSSYIAKMELHTGFLDFIHKLRSKSVMVGIVTDLIAEIQFKKMKALKIENLIDFIVTSEEAGVEKPNKVIFDIALQKAKCFPDEAIMIGDNLEKDIKGAQDHGIRSFLIQDYKDFNELGLLIYGDN